MRVQPSGELRVLGRDAEHLAAQVFEHYSRRAVYGEQVRGLISQAIADLARGLSQAT
jgi:hypothetical protein